MSNSPTLTYRMSELAPDPKRKLVPDLSDQIQVGGQRLAKVKRTKKTTTESTLTDSVVLAPDSALGPQDDASSASPKVLSIDEIARRHLDRPAAKAIEENSDLLRALSQEAELPEEIPPLAEIASRIELFTDDPEVPSDEPDPKKRPGMSMGPIVPTEDAPEIFAGRGTPKTLWDLIAMFPQLDGINWRIHVQRETPKQYGGVPCQGMLNPITQPITLSDWAYYYGGGTYKLVVYGPPKRGGTNLDIHGFVQPRRLTEDITVVFPGPPSLISIPGYADDEEEEEESIMPGMPGLHGPARRGGPSTLGDARIDEVRVNAELTREERQANKDREREEKEERLRKEKEEAKGDVASQIAAMGRQAIDQQNQFRREQAERDREHQNELREERRRFDEKLEAMKNQKPERDPLELLLALKNISGGDESSQKALTEMRRDHQREIERLLAQQKEDGERHARALQDERERADRIIAEEKRRAETRIKEVEEKHAERDREYRARADQEIQKAKDDAERRLMDLDRQHNARILDEARNHERDLKSQATMAAMQLETLKATYDQRLDGKSAEAKRIEADLARARSEADANKDPIAAVIKLKEQAAELGMSEGGDAEPADWKTTLLGMVAGVAGNLPGMVEQFASLGKNKTAEQIELARQQGRQEMIAQAQHFQNPPQLPGPGDSRRSRGFRSMQEASGRTPLIPGEVHPSVLQQRAEAALRPAQANPEPEIVVAGFSMPEPQYQPIPQEQSGMSMLPPEPRPHVAPSIPPPPTNMLPTMTATQPPPPPAPAQGPSVAELQAEDRTILQALPGVQQLYESGAPPALVAQQILQQFGPEMTRTIIGNLGSSQRVLEAIERSGDQGSPFLMRDGKKFLRKLFEELSV